MSRSIADDEVRAALRDKYQRMLALRRAAQAGAPKDPHALRALAERYPGALRELDRAPLEALSARLEQLAHEGLPGWAEPTVAFHLQLRWALEVRRAGGADRNRAEALPAFARQADLLGFAPGELETLMNPPGGRLSRWLLTRIATQRGMALPDLERLLFGHLVGHLQPGW